VFAFEWLLRLLHGLLSWLIGRSHRARFGRLSLPAPTHADDYALIFTADSTFDATALTASFAANLLDCRSAATKRLLADFPRRRAGQADDALPPRPRNGAARSQALRDALPASPSLAAVAHQLHLSPRTLHRRLEDEGSSFQAIKDALRRDLAINRLAKTKQALAQIAAELGFADTTAFYRAFVRWTGMAPAHYRRPARSGRCW
jgi:AraC-like DNA-binding protein